MQIYRNGGIQPKASRNLLFIRVYFSIWKAALSAGKQS